jgi:hypothetical protein
LGIDLLSEAGGWVHLLVSSSGTVPLIIDIVSIVIGHAFPVDESAIRWDGCEVKPMTWDAPAPVAAAAIPATTRATISVPTTSVMTMSMTAAAAMETRAMTGAAIAAIRSMSDGES